ncbi:hypothetical protein L3Q82_014653 [Scortum barcoo]|uniref:Uncharacterized protein n=1 Tax=Scortum barcoo TaxID=214431 RepID=A0ACB8VZL5_9TELE|nr:hypothetical protein L3Q82_014653 [Scortum barcoo]
MQEFFFLEKHFTQAVLGKAPVFFQLRAANGLDIPYTGYAMLDFEVEGVGIPEWGVVVVKDEHCTHPLIIGMNVVTACWNAHFKWPGKSVSPPLQWKNQRVWRDALAICRCVEVTAEDGLLGYVRPARRGNVQIPPESEVLVWGRAWMGPRGADYCALVEALPDTSDVGVARTLAVVRNGRVPVRICNPHPYSLSLGWYEKLGKLYHIDEADVHGPRDLSLSLEGGVELLKWLWWMIEETLNNLTRAEWFSTLDLASGYWQVEMDPQDREKTAFSTPLGLFEFERMPFGLFNAPATFQRLMQQCLNGQVTESLLVYLDDTSSFTQPDFSSHLQCLDEVFQRLWRHGLKLRR